MKYYQIIWCVCFCVSVACVEGSSKTQWTNSNSTLSFTENKGQFTDLNGDIVPFILYKASVPGVDIYLTTTGLSYVFSKYDNTKSKATDHQSDDFAQVDSSRYTWCRMDMHLAGASIHKENITAEGAFPGFTQYFYPHCPDGITDVKNYTAITVVNIYPGIDWKIYTTENKQIKYDFIVHPGANPNNIRLLYEGAGVLSAEDNILRLEMPLGVVQEGKLKTYIEDHKQKVASSYHIESKRETTIQHGQPGKNSYEISFDIAQYDHTKTLIIDPPLTWSTFYGGSSYTYLYSIESDDQNIYMSGYVNSSGFPTYDAGGSSYYDATFSGTWDMIILKFGIDGVQKWATYYGGSGDEYLDQTRTISVLGDQIWIVGTTSSTNFPVLDAGGGAYFQDSLPGGAGSDAFILKFNTSGKRIMATYFGGTSDDCANSVFVKNGSVWITGRSQSSDFPFNDAGGGAYYDATVSFEDIFIARIDTSGVQGWTTLYGASNENIGYSIYVDQHVWVIGTTDDTGFPVQDPGGSTYYQSSLDGDLDMVILKFDLNGVRQWATYFGGNNDDVAEDIFVSGKWVWIVGYTESTQPSFPSLNPGGSADYDGVKNGTRDGMLAQFDTSGVQRLTTYFGGSNSDEIHAITGNDTTIWITGITYAGSSSFPKLDPGGSSFFEGNLNQNDNTVHPDAFIGQYDTLFTREWVTFFGATDGDVGYGIEVDTTYVWLIGITNGASFPLVDPGGSAYYDNTEAGTTDGFISRFGPINAITPVEWLYFDARVNGENTVRTEWATATEIENDYFTILRSADGFRFDPIGYVEGAGNSHFIQEYSFIDQEPLSGLSYYQLKQTDFNGAFDYSDIVAVYRGEQNPDFYVYPNPVSSGSFYVQIPNVSEPFWLTISDPRGKTCFEKQFDVEDIENNRIYVDVTNHLSLGLYYLTVSNQEISYSESVLFETK